MAEQRFAQQPKKKKEKKKEEDAPRTGSSSFSDDKKRRLQELDSFIDGVLEQAGEEFLDEFKQVEGE